MRINPIAFALAAALALVGPTPIAHAQALTPVFTYQGELRLASGPATANYDMQFRLYSAQAGGSQIGITVTAANVAVAGGLFSVPLNFGEAQFAGDRQWLEIAIRPAGAGNYETLSPRNEVTAAPYAWSAAVALGNSVTGTSVIDGSLGAADINAAQIQRRVSGTCAVGNYVRQVNQDGTVVCSPDAAGTGTVTSIATGTGLTGGPISSSGTVAIAAGGVGSAQVNATQVQLRVSGTCAAGNYVREVNQAGTVVCSPDATGAPGWSLGGNAGTNPFNFIGTTDDQPLVLRTRNAQGLRIEPSDILFAGGPPITANIIAGSYANTVTAGVRGASIAGGGMPFGDTDPDFSDEGRNRVTDSYGTVSGGFNNQAGDGLGSTIDSGMATVGGGRGNRATGERSTVGGGSGNTASGPHSTVGGGVANIASGDESTVAGGEFNRATGFISTVSGGQSNRASGFISTVSGGQSNNASGSYSVAGGGTGNFANGFGSTVGGGSSNQALGSRSTVGGGSGNCAGGDFSWAGGLGAQIRPGNEAGDGDCVANSGDAEGDRGTFLWAGRSPSLDEFVSSGSNQFGVRAARVYFGDMDSESVPLSIGRYINTSTGAFLSTGGTWTNASSREFKTAFKSIDPLAVLSKVVSLPLSTWVYKDSVEGMHLGPMAEDFQQAFGLGGDGKSIATVDADGVALAAIQGLNMKLDAVQIDNAALRAELAELRALLLSDREGR